MLCLCSVRQSLSEPQLSKTEKFKCQNWLSDTINIACPLFNSFSPWVSPTWLPHLRSGGCRCRDRASWTVRRGSPVGEQDRVTGRGSALRKQNVALDVSWPGGHGELTPATGFSSSCPSGRGSYWRHHSHPGGEASFPPPWKPTGGQMFKNISVTQLKRICNTLSSNRFHLYITINKAL